MKKIEAGDILYCYTNEYNNNVDFDSPESILTVGEKYEVESDYFGEYIMGDDGEEYYIENLMSYFTQPLNELRTEKLKRIL
jgi:hypothetical protein